MGLEAESWVAWCLSRSALKESTRRAISKAALWMLFFDGLQGRIDDPNTPKESLPELKEMQAYWQQRLRESEIPKVNQSVRGKGEPIFMVWGVWDYVPLRFEDALRLAEEKGGQVLPCLNEDGTPWRFLTEDQLLGEPVLNHNPSPRFKFN